MITTDNSDDKYGWKTTKMENDDDGDDSDNSKHAGECLSLAQERWGSPSKFFNLFPRQKGKDRGVPYIVKNNKSESF